MAATIVLSTVAQIVGSAAAAGVPRPWLFTDYWLGFADFLRDAGLVGQLPANALLQLGYIVVFGFLAFGRFTTKDILS